jgi:imidazolonepropionase-like amidohydrolase/ABC-type multidrug transport system permease subunit
MKAYIALVTTDLRLALRQRSVLFFNYMFPLIFLVVFAQSLHAERGSGAMTQVLTMVTVIGILGNGLFGAGVRAVQEREANILRRYKVTPIGPAPLLIASTITGWILFMPFIILMFALAHFFYGMPLPERIGAICIFVTLGVVAFRSIGMIIAAVVNTMQESQILVQLVYLPMLFLSGATFPSSIFPRWLMQITQFLPATYLVSGMQGMMLRGESFFANSSAAFALILTAFVALFLSYKLFRWEKEEKIRTSAKLWLAAVIFPFVVLGAWQVHSQGNIAKTKILDRQLARGHSYLVRGARLFIGDGKVIENGTLLVRNGKIAAIYEGNGPEPQTAKAEPIEAAGKTILPGLIDVHVHLGAPGGFFSDPRSYEPEPLMLRNLAAYLYSGVTTVRSVGDPLETILRVRTMVNSGERLGAQVFTCGPLFTAPGGHGTEYFKGLPENIRKTAEQQFVRMPGSAAESRAQVDELKKQGLDCIKAILESGGGGVVFNRLDTNLFQAIAQQAHADQLPVAVHTGDARDVADALNAGAASVEHGSFRDAISGALFDQMSRQQTFYDPTLSVGEAFQDFVTGKTDLLKRSLVQQAAPEDLLRTTEKEIDSKEVQEIRRRIGKYPVDMQVADENLRTAQQNGVALVTGSDAGNFLVIHGPTVQHEMELWVKAGIPATEALQAATYNAARLLRAEDHIGRLRPGNDADLLIVDGDPTADISVIERISAVFFKGEKLDRSELFTQE